MYKKKVIMENCKNCQKKLVGKSRTWCSEYCRGRFKYNNDVQFRLNKIERARTRVEETREMAKLTKKKALFQKIVDDYNTSMTMSPEEIQLFNLIYNK